MEKENIAFCPHCGNRAPQRLIHMQRYMEQAWTVSDGKEDQVPWSTFIAECQTCHHVLLYDNPGNQIPDHFFHYGTLVYPATGSLHESVPSSITEIYNEAYRIKSIAPNAFAVQIRRALEAICEDRKAKKGSLQVRLQDLSDKGELPSVLVEASDILTLQRHLF